MYVYERLLRKSLETHTFRELSKMIGPHAATISDWLNSSKQPRIEALEQLAYYYDLPVCAMLAHTENQSPTEILINRLPHLTNTQIQHLNAVIETMLPSCSTISNTHQDQPADK